MDYRAPPAEARAALRALDTLRALTRADTRLGAEAAFADLIRALGYQSYALGIATPTTSGIVAEVACGEGAMAAAARAYVDAGRAKEDPIAARLLTATVGFTLEPWFARPATGAAESALSEHVAAMRALGLRNVATIALQGLSGGRRGALALAGASDEPPERFAVRFAETEWLAALAGTALCARIWDHALAARPEALSASETEAVRRLAQGLRPREIAEALGKSERTVRNQIESAKRRLGVETNAALVARALRDGLIRI